MNSQTCQICGQGQLIEYKETIQVEHNGASVQAELLYSTCNACSSEQTNSDQSRQNKENVLKSRSQCSSKEQFLGANYRIKVRPDEDLVHPGFIAYADELSGLLGYGITPQQAIRDWLDTRADWYDLAIESSVPINPPSESES